MENILKSFPLMLEALNDEIGQLSSKPHVVTLFDGNLEKTSNDSYYYMFEIPEGVFLRIIEEVEIVVHGKTIKGELISLENQFITISLTENQGKNIPHLMITWRSDIILRKLAERLKDISTNPLSFSLDTTQKLFYPIQKNSNGKWKKEVYISKNFNLNQNQQESIDKSLQNHVTFIWGPPGTGKTKTLGTIAYNLIKGGKRILFSSNTNRAVDNGILSIIENYQEHEEDFTKEISRYGKVALIENEALNSVSFAHQLAKLRLELLEKKEENRALLKNFRELRTKINGYSSLMAKVSELDKTITNKEKEFQLIDSHLKTLDNQIKNFGQGSFISTIKNILSGITKEELTKQYEIKEKNKTVSLSEINKIRKERIEIENDLRNLSLLKKQFETLKEQVTKIGGEKELEKQINNETEISETFLLQKKRLIGATLAKIVVNDSFWKNRYDVLIIDEGSMVSLPYLATISALSIEKIIVVGDPQQLPPISMAKIVTSKEWLEQDIFMFASKCKTIEELFLWNKNNPTHTVFLNRQYRMASDLCKIISTFFYEGKLLNGISGKKNGSIVFIDTSHLNCVSEKIPGTKFKPYNKIHTSKIIEAIKYALSAGEYNITDIGIILPFSGSVEYVRNQLKLNDLRKIEVGTVHTFQGREKPVIIFDTVMSGVDYTVRNFDETKTDKYQVKRLLNVALSRAQKDIFIIANLNHFREMYPTQVIVNLLEILNNCSQSI